MVKHTHNINDGTRRRLILSLPYDSSKKEQIYRCSDAHVVKKTAADHSKIPGGKLKIADMTHMYTDGQ